MPGAVRRAARILRRPREQVNSATDHRKADVDQPHRRSAARVITRITTGTSRSGPNRRLLAASELTARAGHKVMGEHAAWAPKLAYAQRLNMTMRRAR
jgi:hypothetical protein